MKAKLVTDKIVLVTGCSTGIGRATARMLKDRGWTVFPTARKPTDLESLRAEGFTPVMLDVADERSVEHAVQEVLEKSGGKLGALVNNAGYGQPGAVEDLTRDALRRQFEVNVFGLQHLSNLVIPLFVRQGFGRIVNVSSVLGRIAVPLLGAYCASKFAVEALSDALRVELMGTGVVVSIIEPGPIETAFRATAHALSLQQVENTNSRFLEVYRRHLAGHISRLHKFERLFSLPPEAVAKKICHALESAHPRRRYRVTFVAVWIEIIRRFCPHALIDAMVSHRLR